MSYTESYWSHCWSTERNTDKEQMRLRAIRFAAKILPAARCAGRRMAIQPCSLHQQLCQVKPVPRQSRSGAYPPYLCAHCKRLFPDIFLNEGERDREQHTRRTMNQHASRLNWPPSTSPARPRQEMEDPETTSLQYNDESSTRKASAGQGDAPWLLAGSPPS